MGTHFEDLERFDWKDTEVLIEKAFNVGLIEEKEKEYWIKYVNNMYTFDHFYETRYFYLDDNGVLVVPKSIQNFRGFMQQEAKEREVFQRNNAKKTGDLILPSELDTERARKYFAKAIEAKYIKVTDNGLQWVFGDSKGQARLGYFCNKVFETPRPINKLEEIFKVKKLSSSISNADIEAKRADVKKWRNEITDTIFND